MPNLVGIGNSQVPTNAMLGGLAYQDSVGEIDLEKIKARIQTPLQGMDIFVYDTRKDSDGGAWRHRTQNTSWYNESPSATRGARKEFPTVAVIVVENGGTYQDVITIYDGDDPNLPMWMVFKSRNAAGGNDQRTSVSYYAAGPYPIRKVVMLNGMMVDCQYRSAGHAAGTVKGVTRYNFINDSSTMMTDEGDFRRNGNLGDERNSERSYQKISTHEIIHTQCNSVAMTVLPNAPIDASTGLPVPTIVVGTDGGTTIIRDNGTTKNYTTIATGDVDIHPDGFMLDGVTGAVNDNYSLFDIHNPTRVTSYGHRVGHHAYNTYLNHATGDCLFEGSSNKIAIAQIYGLLRIEEEFSDYASGLHNRTASSYNTGWMHGDIKGTFLSDTSTTNITGSELVTNGDFAANSNWSYQGGTTSFNISNGKLNYDGSGTIYLKAYQNITGLTVGQTYVLSINLTSISSHNISFAFATSNIGNTILANTVSTTGTHSITWPADRTSISVYVQTNHATQTFSVDDVSLRIAEEDRSANNKGLQVYGTITKEPVANGSELVAYSGFSNSNYLFQPHNTDLQFGTGDYSVMLWYKGSSNSTGNREVFTKVMGASGGEWFVYKEYTNKFSFDGVTDPTTYTANMWYHLAGVRESGIARLYVNGELVGSAATGDNITDTSLGFIIGQDPNNNGWRTQGSLALIRISGSAPSPEQIKKIYNDEKCLYHENAKCTLYGTSDDVKALAYDDSHDILHAGTSAGRSDFRGLNRINNTTTAVTTAISASDGLVAEQ